MSAANQTTTPEVGPFQSLHKTPLQSEFHSYNASIPTRPTRPAIPPPTTAVGREAPPVELLDDAAADDALEPELLSDDVEERVGLATVEAFEVAVTLELAPVPALPTAPVLRAPDDPDAVPPP